MSELIKNGNDKINQFYENSVFILGATGEGKSTLFSAFGGHKLVGKWDEGLKKVIIYQ